MPQNTFYGIDTPFCCSRKTHPTAEQKPYAAVYHYHDAYEIFLFINGKASMYYDDEYYPMNNGDLYIIPPGKPHGAACYDSKVYDRLVINIHRELLEQLSVEGTDLTEYLDGEEPDRIKVVNLDSKAQKRLIHLVEGFNALEEHTEGFGAQLEKKSRTTILMVTINRFICECHEQMGKKIRPKLIDGILDYVSEHLTEPISLQDLSARFYISSKYISSVFHKNMGMTLREYIIKQRVENAKKLLSEGKNVSEACGLSGFGDYSNFIRTFTMFTGVSPGKYARQHLSVK